MDKILRALNKLTGEQVEVSDLLEYAEPVSSIPLGEEAQAWLGSDLSRLGEYGSDAHKDLEMEALELVRYDPELGWVRGG